MLSTTLCDEADPKDTFKIMVASDIHLGYNEKDQHRGEDSFNSFEEVLRIANERDVDFVLLGGDLFDANKPSPYSLHRCIEIVRKYTFGDRELNFQIATTFENCDASLADEMRASIPYINFYDENLNIGTPIFSIHGNHDDPCGMRSISSLDMLSSMGLVNYVGRWDRLDELKVHPLVLKKGATTLALYGIGHMSDKRLSRLFRDGKVRVTAVGPETAFQLLVMHQNRANRGVLNYIPFTHIPEFMDLVVWGHEHDCFIEPEPVNGMYIMQPGSTVATSLTHGESRPKHCAILHVHRKQFHVEAIRLRSVRPLVHRVVFVERPLDVESDLSSHAKRRVMQEIDEILVDVERERAADGGDLLPLVRVVVHHVDERQTFNEMSLAFAYEGKVANPRDLVLFKREKREKAFRFAANGNGVDDDDDDLPTEEEATLDIGSFVKKELREKLVDLQVMTADGICESLHRLIEYDDAAAFVDYENFRQDKFIKCMSECLNSDDDDDDATLEERLREGMQKLCAQDDASDVREMFNNSNMRAKQATATTTATTIVLDDDDDDDDDEPMVMKVTPAAKKRGGRGSRGGRGRAAKTKN